ncbi:hypothetical protein AB4254_08895 [Vibrio breoganii]
MRTQTLNSLIDDHSIDYEPELLETISTNLNAIKNELNTRAIISAPDYIEWRKVSYQRCKKTVQFLDELSNNLPRLLREHEIRNAHDRNETLAIRHLDQFKPSDEMRHLKAKISKTLEDQKEVLASNNNDRALEAIDVVMQSISKGNLIPGLTAIAIKKIEQAPTTTAETLEIAKEAANFANTEYKQLYNKKGTQLSRARGDNGRTL